MSHMSLLDSQNWIAGTFAGNKRYSVYLKKKNYHGFIQRVLSTAIYAIFNQPIMICLVIYQFAMESSQLKKEWFDDLH